MKKIRVLVVDDSFVIRNVLEQSLNADPQLEVVATASDAYEARDLIIKLRPDVMTLDIEMPRMNGLDFLRRLMPQYPMPVVVVSSLDDRVFDALEAGAVDFVHKPAGLTRSQLSEFMKQELNEKVKVAFTVRVGARPRRATSSPVDAKLTGSSDKDIVAIGASTGGTEAIFDVVSKFNTDIPGVVIVQHMPPGFTAMYAERMNNQCKVAVKEAQNGDKVKQGLVLLAPGDKQMRVIKERDGYHVECKFGEKVSGHCPSVNVLFNSVAVAAKDKAVGVILTGMGGDGAEGLMEMHRQGAVTIGQDEVTSAVYGMPKVAYEMGAVTYQVGLPVVASKIYSVLNNRH
ncbi:MAG: chemotaxis response regulator protein-glutamate methylesterase [Lachnospiraceae bacterium]|jgi:two-component system chemotaxis response regulator CheB|nr:chemotaxis response regulator protein-glutamate methylesterase [Lachnospiraceae bacterium]